MNSKAAYADKKDTKKIANMVKLRAVYIYILVPFGLICLSILCIVFRLSMVLNVAVMLSAMTLTAMVVYKFFIMRQLSGLIGIFPLLLIVLLFIWIPPYKLRDFYYSQFIDENTKDFVARCRMEPRVAVSGYEIRTCKSFDFSLMNQIDTIMLITPQLRPDHDAETAHLDLGHDKIKSVVDAIATGQGISKREYSDLISLNGFGESGFRYSIVSEEIAILNFDLNLSPTAMLQ